jgi:hypothetical protein
MVVGSDHHRGDRGDKNGEQIHMVHVHRRSFLFQERGKPVAYPTPSLRVREEKQKSVDVVVKGTLRSFGDPYRIASG